MRILRLCVAVLICIGVVVVGCKERRIRHTTIGTGGVTGLYYPTGCAIRDVVNKKSDTLKLKVTVASTDGSVFNINAVIKGDLDFGVAQSDRQYQAYTGRAEWEETGRQTDLRSVFSIHKESVTLVTSEKANINDFEDLRGKRVNVGNHGSGQLQNAKDVLHAAGLTEADIDAKYVEPVYAPALLKDDSIDAYFYTVGHPNSNITEATYGQIRVRLLPIKGAGIDSMLNECDFYTRSEIPCTLYNIINDEDIATISVRASLVTSKNQDEKMVYAITKEVFDNLQVFKTLNPVLETLTKESMLEGMTAPIHKGALRYYREAGLDTLIDSILLVDEVP
jgi:TRAP transporter TAXI family solute receptor